MNYYNGFESGIIVNLTEYGEYIKINWLDLFSY